MPRRNSNNSYFNFYRNKLLKDSTPTAFPAFVAENCHQFHDGFNWGEDYPKIYNSLAAKFAKKEVEPE